jgi:hypothetical protein
VARKRLNIRITGVEQTFSKLKDKYDSAIQEVDMEMAASTEQMATTAKSIFPNGNPQIEGETQIYAAIRATIRSEKNKPFSYTIISGEPRDDMSAYIEFGTGRYFPQYPGKEKEWQALAKEYYVNGRGWMKPSPYFYPSVTSGIVSLVNNIKQIFKRNERL